MLLDEVKLSLRVTTDAFDEEINNLIEAAKLDLHNAGINPDDANPLIKVAIKTYCRINFGNYEKADELRKAYKSQIVKLQVAAGYKRGVESG